MDVDLFGAAMQALGMMVDPTRLMFLALGVVIGLVVGVIPGIGGLAGTALILPFTFAMDPATAIAFLLGLGAVISTGDPIPAILFGVPGGAGSAATVLDGLPMAKRGEAGRALAAAYTSSLIGGLFGAALLAFSIPLLRPLVMLLGSPELLALSIFGISMVAVLSGSAPLRGLAIACFGVMLAMIGSDPQTGTLRWTMGMLYLYDGLPLVPVVLGLFALPEVIDLAIGRTSISAGARQSATTGMLHGVKDTFRHIWLVLRCSWLGSALGIVPGIGSAIIDWLAYGHALRTEKNARETFGKGDVRGVIAAESANNAREGGVLVPTIAFGVPGSAGMALLLSAFIMHGLVPGPTMLTTNVHITYSMVWSVAMANILGAGLCFAFSGYFARLATLPFSIIFPAVLSITFIGAYAASHAWEDIFLLVMAGVVGWIMKHLKWPRPPLVLGFVLGAIIEQNMFISIARYQGEWLTRPIVLVILVMALLGFTRPILRELKAEGGIANIARQIGRPRFYAGDLFYVAFGVLLAFMLATAMPWQSTARLVPVIVGVVALLCIGISLLNLATRRSVKHGADSLQQPAETTVRRSMHMDLAADWGDLNGRQVMARAAQLFAWTAGLLGSMMLVGAIASVFLFIAAFMRFDSKEPWRRSLAVALGITAFIYLIFEVAFSFNWPASALGQLLPALRAIPSI